ncbi:S8 family peptidase [Paenibacillus tengchongensis]|uniref:S8 family peptidase n=1 Tax=Paenibacillus tengchongensis TaxID=2608684 RepID=UPI0016522EC1|nr:S8 family peptidase [Paenibacillus tengchongensis]
MKEQPRNKPYQAAVNIPLARHVRSARKSGGSAKPIPVIVQLKYPVTASRLDNVHKHLGSGHTLRIKRRLPLINAVSASLSPACLEKLCSCREIGKVYLDSVKKASLYIATPSIGATAVRNQSGLTGKGINIAVLDTGVYPHPDLIRPVNRIVAFKDLINGQRKPYDDNGHGTHIAGDAAGNGWASKGKYCSPAPQAGIVGVKVLDANGDGFDSTIIKGIEWCIRNRKRLKLRILSMSFGGQAGAACADDPLCQAVEKAVRAGLTCVIAAGNSGPAPRTVESPGTSPSAITVGAVDDRRTIRQSDDRMTWYSSRGPAPGGKSKPDIVAPGETIISLLAPRSELARQFPYMRIGKRYFVLSGTSVSAPVVSGAAAQLLQRNPELTPREVKQKLKRNAFRLGYKRNTAGSGEVNVRFLLRK